MEGLKAGDNVQSHQVTSQVLEVHCDRVTHTLKCPSVTLAAAEVTEGHNWYYVTKAVLKWRMGIMDTLSPHLGRGSAHINTDTKIRNTIQEFKWMGGKGQDDFMTSRREIWEGFNNKNNWEFSYWGLCPSTQPHNSKNKNVKKMSCIFLNFKH